MDTNHVQSDDILDTFILQSNHVLFDVREKFFTKVFGKYPYASEAYMQLKKLQPLESADGSYHGDVNDFLGQEVQTTYKQLQQEIKVLRDMLELEPRAGEPVLIYIDRLLQESIDLITTE